MEKEIFQGKPFTEVISLVKKYYDDLEAPSITSLIPARHIDYMRDMATSIRLSSKVKYKINEFMNVMSSYGFIRCGAGTHRQVYRHTDNKNIVVKLSINKSSINDNIAEFLNKSKISPFCTKVFETDNSGFIGLFERANCLSSKDYKRASSDISCITRHLLRNGIIMDDIGSDYFMNWGMRTCGDMKIPILLDFSDVYDLDPNKLECSRILPDENKCDGIISYDDGFNQLKCTKCGCPYAASELARGI